MLSILNTVKIPTVWAPYVTNVVTLKLNFILLPFSNAFRK